MLVLFMGVATYLVARTHAPFSPVFPSSSEVGIQLNSITGTLYSPSVGNTLLSSSLSLGSRQCCPEHESTALSLRASKTALKHLAPYAFPRVQQECSRLLTEHKKRLNDLKSKNERGLGSCYCRVIAGGRGCGCAYKQTPSANCIAGSVTIGPSYTKSR